MTLIKICGITSLADALAAVAAGADALGFNFYEPSPRYVSPRKAHQIIDLLPESVTTVGVFVNEESPQFVRNIAAEAGVSALQLHGDESPGYCRDLADYFVIKALPATDGFDVEQAQAYEVDAIMLDTRDDALRGGTGRVFNWSIAQRVNSVVPKLFLAGGLSPENIEVAIAMVRPYAVDACSGLEESPGKKNPERVRAFVNKVRSVRP